jgi:hypothetical protein
MEPKDGIYDDQEEQKSNSKMNFVADPIIMVNSSSALNPSRNRYVVRSLAMPYGLPPEEDFELGSMDD